MRLDKLTRMSRRGFLTSLASMGVTGKSLDFATKEAVAETDLDVGEEVPVLKGWEHTNHSAVINDREPPKRKPIYFTVNRDRWIRVESARDAARAIRSKLSGTGVTVCVGSVISGQRRQLGVKVKYPIEEYQWGGSFRPNISFEELQDKLPATATGVAGRDTDAAYSVQGIPVVSEKVHTNLEYYDCNYRPVPAGCAWRNESGAGCTMGTPVYDWDVGEYRLVSASHCFYGAGPGCYQNEKDGSEKIGERDPDKIDFRHDPLFDAAVIDVKSQYDVKFKRADYFCDQYQGKSISTTLSESSLTYMMEDGDELTKQGKTTGITSGPITDVSSSAFYVDTAHDGGDSGGPYFSEYQDRNGNTRTAIAGIHRGGGGDAEGTQMENIEDRFDVMI